MAPTGIDRIELTLRTYRAFLAVSEAMDMRRAARVVAAWKGSIFKGATLATRDLAGKWSPISLASVCAMFDVKVTRNASTAAAPRVEEAAAPAPKAAKKPRAKVAPAPVEAPAAAPEAPSVVEAPAAEPAHVAQRLTLFTLGFDGGLGVERVAEVVKERAIDLVVDIRSKANTSIAFEISKLRALWGDRYTTKSQLKGGIAAILPRLQEQGSARVLLLRKEEAPGDHWASLELGRLAIAAKIPCIHLFQNEEVDAIELQRAIDLDIQQGGDHYYSCDVEIDDLADARAKARTRIEKLDRLAKGNPNANEGKSAKAEAARLRAQFGIREAA